MSAYDILEEVRSCGIKAPLSVYRALDRLISEGLVHRVESLAAYVACRSERHGEHPFFAICSDCGRTEEFNEDEVFTALVGRASQAGFKARSGTIELHGQCSACTSAGRADGET